jgi:hypothetical protein
MPSSPPIRPLLFTPEQHAQALKLVGEFSLQYLATVAERPVYPPVDRAALRKIGHEPLPRQGLPLETLFAELEDVLVPNSTHSAHPRFLPYVNLRTERSDVDFILDRLQELTGY